MECYYKCTNACKISEVKKASFKGVDLSCWSKSSMDMMVKPKDVIKGKNGSNTKFKCSFFLTFKFLLIQFNWIELLIFSQFYVTYETRKLYCCKIQTYTPVYTDLVSSNSLLLIRGSVCLWVLSLDVINQFFYSIRCYLALSTRHLNFTSLLQEHF